MVYKRLEKGTFPFPDPCDAEASSVTVNATDLIMLLDGVDLQSVERRPPYVREYWVSQVKRRLGEVVSSHRVEYPYSFYALAKDVKDEDLKRRILAKVYRLTATN